MAGWFIGWRMRCCFRLEKVNIGLLPSWTLLLAPWRAHLWTLWFESHLLQFFFLFTRHCSHSVLVFDWAGSLVWFACQAWTFDPQQGWLVFQHISFSMRASFNSFTMSESFRVTVELCPKQWQTERPPAVKTSRAGCEQFDVASLISPWTRLPHRLNLVSLLNPLLDDDYSHTSPSLPLPLVCYHLTPWARVADSWLNPAPAAVYTHSLALLAGTRLLVVTTSTTSLLLGLVWQTPLVAADHAGGAMMGQPGIGIHSHTLSHTFTFLWDRWS